MKFPAAAKYPIAIAVTALMTSCDEPKKPQGQIQHKLTTEELAREAEFGPWMSQAGLLFAQEQLPAGEYFAEIEGRVNHGENQYRAIQRTLDTEKYSRAEAMWGLDAGVLFRLEIERLRKGMERSWSQVFTDTTGKAIHQVVMVLPVGASPNLTSGEAEADIETLGANLEAGIAPPPPPGLTASEVARDEDEDLLDSVDGSTANSPEVTPLAEVDREVESGSDSAAEPDMGDAPDPAPNDLEEVDEVIGELDTVEPEAQSEDGERPDEPGTPARGEVVEDDEEVNESGSENELAEATTETAEDEEEDSPVVEEPEPVLPKFVSYTVVRGDTLSGLARRYKVSISAIKKASGIRSDMLQIGQVLNIPTE